MRRLVFSVIAVSGLLVAGSSPALADDPAPTVSAKSTPGKRICKVTDTKLDELSGIVATSSGFIAIDDSSIDPGHHKVFFLSDKCKVTKSINYSGTPIDTEDLILSPDGKTLWIADTGDDSVRSADPKPRDHIALWSMKADGSSKPKIYRIAYPEGDYHDAEALLLQNGTIPLLVTKELGKPASIYQPSAPLKANNETPTPLKKVGELTLSGTTTPSNTVAQIGNKTIDGGAIAPGGAKVALRTYTDALEWDVTNGDVLSALKNGKPRTTGLPNEPFGEAITYSPDGKFFYTVSDMNGDHTTANYILQYTPATTVAVAAKASDAGPTTHWYSNLTLNQITLMVGGVGVIGLILVGVGVLGIMRSRKRAALEPAAYDDDSSPGDPETELIGVGGAQQRGVYGGARASGMPAADGVNSGGVYGASGGGAQRGPVYGSGGGGGAPQYARPAGAQPPARAGQPPARAGQPPARGGQPGPARGGQPPARGGQQPPARAPQPPARGGQQPPARGPQQAPGRGVYGGGGQAGGGQGRGPAPQGQRPQGGGGGQGRGPAPQGQRPQGGGQGQRPQGGGQGMPPSGRPQHPQGGQRPQGGSYGSGQRPRDDRAEFGGRPEGRFDNPGYRR
jgi:hypothetical protein